MWHMEGTTNPAQPESTTLQEAIRYYSDLDAATGAFSAPWCSKSKENFCNRGRFSIPAVPRWSVWSANRSDPRR